MIIFATALAMFAIFYALFAEEYGESVRRQPRLAGVRLADSLAEELNIAARSGDGYSRRIEFQPRIPGATGYSLFVNNVSGSVDLEMNLSGGERFYYTSPLVTRDLVGDSRYAEAGGFRVDLDRPAVVENRGGIVLLSHARALK